MGRLALTGAAVVTAGLLSGLGAWLGGVSQGVDLDLGSMVGAGLNVVPTALVTLGIGAIVLATFPRAAAAAVYAVIGWSLLVDLLGSLVGGMEWLSRLTLFHYMALAPAQDPSVTTLAFTLAIALMLCVVWSRPRSLTVGTCRRPDARRVGGRVRSSEHAL